MFIEAKNDRRTNLEDWEVAELTNTSYWRYEQDENGEDIIDHADEVELALTDRELEMIEEAGSFDY